MRRAVLVAGVLLVFAAGARAEALSGYRADSAGVNSRIVTSEKVNSCGGSGSLGPVVGAGHHYAGHWHAGHDGPDGRSGRWPGTNIRADSKRLGLRVLP
jgi:hypothetical protein